MLKSKILLRFSSSVVKKIAPKQNNFLLDSVAEASFFSQHRPLAINIQVQKQPEPKSLDEQEWYNDEYASLFNAFVPFVAPGRDFESQALPLHIANDFSHLDAILEELKLEETRNPIGNGPRRIKNYQMISIMKRRRKKMNKHKWKKHRRSVRNSTRYNKEKLRKAGTLRKKQE